MATSSQYQSIFTLLLENIQKFVYVTLKEDKSNYLVWRNQIKSVLIHTGLYDFANDTYLIPEESDDDSEHIFWQRMDKLAKYCLQTTIDDDVSSDISGLATAHEIWSYLQNEFAQKLNINKSLLQNRLASIKKGNSCISSYVHEIELIIDSLKEIGEDVVEYDIVMIVLSGLGNNYRKFVDSYCGRVQNYSLEDCKSSLLAYELLLKDIDLASLPLTSKTINSESECKSVLTSSEALVYKISSDCIQETATSVGDAVKKDSANIGTNNSIDNPVSVCVVGEITDGVQQELTACVRRNQIDASSDLNGGESVCFGLFASHPAISCVQAIFEEVSSGSINNSDVDIDCFSNGISKCPIVQVKKYKSVTTDVNASSSVSSVGYSTEISGDCSSATPKTTLRPPDPSDDGETGTVQEDLANCCSDSQVSSISEAAYLLSGILTSPWMMHFILQLQQLVHVTLSSLIGCDTTTNGFATTTPYTGYIPPGILLLSSYNMTTANGIEMHHGATCDISGGNLCIASTLVDGFLQQPAATKIKQVPPSTIVLKLAVAPAPTMYTVPELITVTGCFAKAFEGLIISAFKLLPDDIQLEGGCENYVSSALLVCACA